jgi:hypothetical protein
MRVLLAALTLILLTSCTRSEGSIERAQDAPPVVPTVKVARLDLVNDLVLTAEFEPFQQVDLMAKVSERRGHRRPRSHRTGPGDP